MRIIDNTANPTAWPMLFDVYRTHRGEKARKPFIIARNLEKAWYRLERRITRYRSH